MVTSKPRHDAEGIARRGDEIYEQQIRAQVEATHFGKVVAIDVNTGAWALAETVLAVVDSLRARVSNPETWIMRVGYRALSHLRSPRVDASDLRLPKP